MFKKALLLTLALLSITKSQPQIEPIDQRESCLGSFVVARQEEFVEDGGIIQVLDQNVSYVANSSPQSVLASIIEPEPERNNLYDLVNLVGQPYKRNNCPIKYQCVSFVEKIMEREFDADAKNIPVNEKQPCEKCAVVMYGGPFGHIAYIMKVATPSFEIIEANHLGCGKISTRSLNFEELNNVKGYIK
ncbi:MAG: hypothetical protein H7831_09905 [Magnetococcus sp. WYHC-3]